MNQEPLTKEQAMHYALRLLNQRQYSQAMLRKKLLFRKTAPQDVEHVLNRLVELNLVNDARYAESFVRNESLYKHASSRFIAQKLRQKGVSAEVIEKSFAKSKEELPSEIELASYHAHRYVARLKESNWQDIYKKTVAYLYRKGFSSRAITEAMQRVKNEK